MKAAFHTLGCKVNQYESEAMREQFAAAGFELVGEDELADVYVINTCTVTGIADRKSRQYIRRMKRLNPAAVVAVTGCYAQIGAQELWQMPEVDIVAGSGEKGRLLSYVQEALAGGGRSLHVRGYDELCEYQDRGIICSMESRTRAYIKVQEGCDRFCAYCVIPLARGKVRSRDPQEVVAEAKALLSRGFKELILTGINTALYGREESFVARYPGWEDGIEGLIAALNALPGDFRLRLSSLEPAVVNADYVKRLLKYERLCHHLHLSAQSGSDHVLALMNRPYTAEQYLRIAAVLREFDPLYGISTDIIAGFPGETEDDFAASLRLIEQAGFCKVHAFRYSRRPGTAAAERPQQVASQQKNARVALLVQAGERAAQDFFRRAVKDRRRVLFEEREGSYLAGYTDNYIKVYARGGDEFLNSFQEVKLLEIYKDGMKGEI